jgi:hypothetical protein
MKHPGFTDETNTIEIATRVWPSRSDFQIESIRLANLRISIARAAMQGILANAENGSVDPAETAYEAVNCADALIEQLRK